MESTGISLKHDDTEGGWGWYCYECEQWLPAPDEDGHLYCYLCGREARVKDVINKQNELVNACADKDKLVREGVKGVVDATLQEPLSPKNSVKKTWRRLFQKALAELTWRDIIPLLVMNVLVLITSIIITLGIAGGIQYVLDRRSMGLAPLTFGEDLKTLILVVTIYLIIMGVGIGLNWLMLLQEVKE